MFPDYNASEEAEEMLEVLLGPTPMLWVQYHNVSYRSALGDSTNAMGSTPYGTTQ